MVRYIVTDIDANCNIFFKYFFEKSQLFAKNPIHSRLFDKKPRFSRKTLNNLQNLPKTSFSLQMAFTSPKTASKKGNRKKRKATEICRHEA